MAESVRIDDADMNRMSLEGALGGLAFLESIMDEDLDGNLDLLMTQYTLEERHTLLVQFCTAWLVSETHVHQQPVTDYLKELRARLLASNFTW